MYLKKNSIAFHNISNYDYHFIIKDYFVIKWLSFFTEEFKKQFICLGENTEKYINFTVLIEKEVTGIDENGEGVTKNASHMLQFIKRARFFANSLSILLNNFSEGIHKFKGKHEHDDKKC